MSIKKQIPETFTISSEQSHDKVHPQVLKMCALNLGRPLSIIFNIIFNIIFLSKRKQRVVRGDFVSIWVEVTSGVPQGSVYGPTLFIIYVNDIPGMLSSLVKLYAHDTKLLADVSNHEGKISFQSDLDLISNWSKDWLVKLNASKCKVMHFGTRNNKYRYRLNERLLEENTTERDLGVCISNNLKWEHQCNKAAAKANRMLGVL